MGDKVSAKLCMDTKAATQDVQIKSQSAWDYLKQGVFWNSSARVEVNTDPEIKQPFVTTGNVTEQGLLKYFMHDL